MQMIWKSMPRAITKSIGFGAVLCLLATLVVLGLSPAGTASAQTSATVSFSLNNSANAGEVIVNWNSVSGAQGTASAGLTIHPCNRPSLPAFRGRSDLHTRTSAAALPVTWRPT